jgi:hypothetical protein
MPAPICPSVNAARVVRARRFSLLVSRSFYHDESGVDSTQEK